MIKSSIKKLLLYLFHKVISTAEGKQILFDGIKDTIVKPDALREISYCGSPYFATEVSDESAEVIFITGRFRSGSTLMWNLFRHAESCTSYYEPFNERQWFCKKTRGDRLDLSHQKVTEYWSEYDSLPELKRFYQEDWIRHHLYMDANFWDDNMYRFIEHMIKNTKNQCVLQFNRIDFRLPWIRHHFPKAKIIHIYRSPREQWCSTLIDINSFPYDQNTQLFSQHDHFYLLNWKNDLKYHFPFLEQAENPYQIFYYVWRLSYLFGLHYSDVSISFENLVENPDTHLPIVMQYVENYDRQKLKNLIVRNQKQRHTNYAALEWFKTQELSCERVLKRFFHKTK